MIRLKPSKWARYTIYFIVTLSLTTGLSFFVLNTWITVEGEFGPLKHPWQFPTLKIHAASAFAMMILYGMLWASHIQYGWRSQRSRRTGIFMTAFICFQILTAYLLYYLSDETLREFTTWLHLGAGISLPVMLFLHVIAARRFRNRPAESDPVFNQSAFSDINDIT